MSSSNTLSRRTLLTTVAAAAIAPGTVSARRTADGEGTRNNGDRDSGDEWNAERSATCRRVATADGVELRFEDCTQVHFRGTAEDDYHAEALVVTHGVPHDFAGDQPDRDPRRLSMNVGLPAAFPQTIDSTEWIGEMIVDPPAESSVAAARITRGPSRAVVVSAENPDGDCLSRP